MLIRPEVPADIPAIRAVTAAAFTGVAHSAPPVEPDGAPGEATLVGWLRADAGWIPELSLVAEDAAGKVIGHVVCTRAFVDGAPSSVDDSRGPSHSSPALGLGPLSVLPQRQGAGVGAALMRAVLAAAEERGEPLVVLIGNPRYYSRFGFRPAAALGIQPPNPAWGNIFQVRTLGAYDPAIAGTFRYAAAFEKF